MFLRGHGSQEYVQNNGSYRSVSEQTTKHVSGSLGSIQGDSVREAWGNMLSRPLDTDTSTTETVNSSIWPAAVGNNGFFRLVSRGSAYLPVNYEHFSAKIPSYISQIRLSFMLPTANEIRPINIAVKYIIKVK